MSERPGLLGNHGRISCDSAGMRRLIVSLGLAALLTAGVLSWFASEKPDGLEYSITKVTGQEEFRHDDTPPWFRRFRQWSGNLAIFPDYQPRMAAAEKGENKPRPQPSFQGNAMVVLAGTALVGAIIILISLLMHRRQVPSLALTHDHDHDHSHDHPHDHDHDHDHPHDHDHSHDHDHPHDHSHDHDHDHPHDHSHDHDHDHPHDHSHDHDHPHNHSHEPHRHSHDGKEHQ